MRQKLVDLYARALVVLKAAPTWLTMAAVVISTVAAGIPIPVVAQIAATVVAAIGSAVAIIRRVTPVLPDERGVLPPTPEAVAIGADGKAVLPYKWPMEK